MFIFRKAVCLCFVPGDVLNAEEIYDRLKNAPVAEFVGVVALNHAAE